MHTFLKQLPRRELKSQSERLSCILCRANSLRPEANEENRQHSIEQAKNEHK